MNADYQDVMARFTEAGLGRVHEVRVDNFPYSPSTVAHAVMQHFRAQDYDIPRGGFSETHHDSKVQLTKDGALVLLVATRVGDRTRANIVDIAAALAAG
jgi:hypothetical protein